VAGKWVCEKRFIIYLQERFNPYIPPLMTKLFSLLSVLLLSVSAFGAGAVGKMQGAAVAVEAPDDRMSVAAAKIGWTLAKAKEVAAKDRDLHVSADNRRAGRFPAEGCFGHPDRPGDLHLHRYASHGHRH
jgi:hypothetical protein